MKYLLSFLFLFFSTWFSKPGSEKIFSSGSSNLASDLDGSLWAYYPFDTDILDKSGNERVLQVINGAVLMKHDNCNSEGLYLDGYDDYAVIEEGKNFPEGDFTIAFYLFPEKSKGRIFQKGNFNNALGASFGITFYEQTSELASSISKVKDVCINYTDYYTVNSLETGMDLQSGQWIHIAMVHEHGFQKLYANGKLLKSEPTDRLSFKNCQEATFNLGVWWKEDPRFFKGLFDELRIYTRALNSNEIQDLFNIRKASKTSTDIL